MQIVKFNGERIEYKSSHKALREYERIFGKPADKIETYTDSTNLMYAIVRTNAIKQGIKFEMTVDEFIDWMDDNPGALEGFGNEAQGHNGAEAQGEEPEKKS